METYSGPQQDKNWNRNRNSLFGYYNYRTQEDYIINNKISEQTKDNNMRMIMMMIMIMIMIMIKIMIIEVERNKPYLPKPFIIASINFLRVI